MSDPIQYIQDRQREQLAELQEWLRIPSVSAQSKHRADVHAAAAWIDTALREAGMENGRVIETNGHPLVYADWLHAGADAPTVLIYGHYDVQPPDPLDLWNTPPFEPTIDGDYIYARGAADDKGQAYIHVKAVEAYLKTNGRLPVNVKFIIEGEEEMGGRSLEAFIPANKELLAADVALISDTHIISPDQPAIVYGLRGMSYMLVDVVGPALDLHSGSYGGAVDNPINALAHIIAKLKDENGRILIPGFYDNVPPLSADERAILAKHPLTEDQFLAEMGAPAVWGEPEYTLAERIGARPTLDVNGIVGGYTGEGAKTVLPSKAHAKISMRLVPNQDADEIAQLFTDYVKKIAPPTVKIKVTFVHGAAASITDWKIPAMQAAAAAYADVFGVEPIYTREGGSIPVVSQLQQHLGVETILMGFGLPDDRIHSPNERFYIPNFYRGVETAVRFLANLAK